MNELQAWTEQNERFLGLALRWLSLRLEDYIERGGKPKPILSTPPSPQVASSLFGWMQTGTPPNPTRSAAPASPETEETKAARAMREVQEGQFPPALTLLANRFDLSPFEQSVLLLCAAIELDTRTPALCARAQDDPQRPYPTFALVLSLFDDPAWDVLSPERPLRYWRFLEINQPGSLPLTTSPLRVDERIVNFLKGLNYVDDRLVPFLVPLEIGGEIGKLPPSHQRVVDTIVNQLRAGREDQMMPIIQLLGTDSASKQLIAQRAAAAFGLYLYRLSAELIPTQLAELETLSRLWERESRLLPLGLYLDSQDAVLTSLAAEQSRAIHRFVERSNTPLFWDTRELQPGLIRPSLTVDIERPSLLEQQAAWETILGATGDWPARLAGQFNLNLLAIQQVARTMAGKRSLDSNERSRQLWEACLISTRPQLDRLAQRIDPKATWEDIVLPEEELLLLQQIAGQVGQRSRVYDHWGFRQKMNRGLGISVLFAGESGTGKTMAAEVMANHLRLNLYRIDLSAVVSKYIGETEKNLRRLFDAAEDGGAILFFDEADALFGKRSEVKDSHDRYANIEINYLLQRMEGYRGLAILATNMKKALDHAFLRRLRFTVNFPYPGPEERWRIWQKVFPKDTPTEALDFHRLAALNLTGGSIHNIAINAAFLAAQRNEPCVTMPALLAAARIEFRKLEQPITEFELRQESRD